MKKTVLVDTLLAAAAIFSTSLSIAQENGGNVIYLGIGAADKGNPDETDKNPYSVGYLKLSNSSDTVFGIDISGEGTKLDSTYNQNQAVKQATSFNLLFGTNLNKTENTRLDVALLAGIRGKTVDCPSSFLGYQCYADTEPDTKYGFNYGAVLTLTYKSFLLGVRATGESTQALFGLRF